ncbi:hypothetical protein J6590_015930 [Homalodisca vitripennis]|nr:hypothetical protein J6590_105002 [Homalodisca vitripennis]KAG8312746.1 hypothetical protein J6590_015930 [Homalodisca vitripennis]
MTWQSRIIQKKEGMLCEAELIYLSLVYRWLRTCLGVTTDTGDVKSVLVRRGPDVRPSSFFKPQLRVVYLLSRPEVRAKFRFPPLREEMQSIWQDVDSCNSVQPAYGPS